jgi:hypothetical protein
LAAQYGVQAGEKLLQSYGFRQAVDAFRPRAGAARYAAGRGARI